jgi:23S rRNA (guanosine2251-2'-O)-methyltransferase
MSSRIVIGRHAVQALLNTHTPIEKLFVKERRMDNALNQLIASAKSQRIAIQWLSNQQFNERFSGDHQGIACLTHDYPQMTVPELIAKAPNHILVLDHLNDPHNVGAICRSAVAFGVSHLIYPKDRAVPLTPAVEKAAAGTMPSMTFTKVVNVGNTLRLLKKAGYWVYAASSNTGSALPHTAFNTPLVLICGAEHNGISPGLAPLVDEYVHIPMPGNTNSLNVSVATGIILYAMTTN